MSTIPILRKSSVHSLLWALIVLVATALPMRAMDEVWSADYGCWVGVFDPYVVNGNDPPNFDWAGYVEYQNILYYALQDNNSTTYLDSSQAPVDAGGGCGGGSSGSDLAANPFLNAVNGQPITNAQAAQQFFDAANILKTAAPAVYATLMEKLNNNTLGVETLAKLGLQTQNSQDPSKTQAHWVAGVYNQSSDTMVIVANSLTTPKEIAAVLIHELTHMSQDLVENKTTANTPTVDLEAPAWKAQYEFMNGQGMDTSMFTAYLDGGSWSDAKFKTEYTATKINTGDGGTWQQTGKYYTTQNSP